MAETTITGLPNATTPLDGTERVPMDQNGATKDASTQDIADLAGAAITSAVNAHVAAADPHSQYLTAAEGDAAYATAAQGALASTAIQPGNAALSDAREWSAATIEQAEAEAGTATTRRAFTAQRVFQAIAAWWSASSAKTKLDGIETGAQVNVATNLTYDAPTREVRSSTGSDATLPLVSTTNAGLAPATGEPSGKYLKDDGTWATVEAGASPAGSGTEIQYRNSSALGAIPNSSVDGSTGAVTLARLILAANGAASTPPLGLTGTWFTGGTSTTAKPQFLIEPAGTTSTAWSTSGTGLGVNAPSGFTGNLLDLQVNGSQRIFGTSNGYLYISPGDGSTNAHGLGFIGRSCGISAPATNTFRIGRDNSADIYIGVSLPDQYINLRSTLRFGWASAGADGGQDLSLFRDAADTLAQRRTTNAQTFRCYGTYTDASNYVRASLSSTSTAVTLAAETAGTGADDIPLNLTAAGTGTVKVNSVVEVAVSSTVAGLPTAPTVGMLTRVTDATAPAVGSTVSGGGAAAALVWWNGSNWTVIGV